MKFTLLLVFAAVAFGLTSEPRVVVESAPQYGTIAPVVFRIEGISASEQNPFVSWFLPDAGWFTPACGTVTSDGSGRYSAGTSPFTAYATKVFIASLPLGVPRPCVNNAAALPDNVAGTPVRLIYHRSDPARRIIAFSGRLWTVKGLPGYLVGPGPNVFSSLSQNVWVDDSGRLHLRITPCGGGNGWCSAEVILNDSPGYGEYRFVIDTPLSSLHPNAVLGMFTWNEDPLFNHREIDIEISRWRNTTPTNAQFVVQPYTSPGNMLRFNAPTAAAPTTWAFDWAPQSVNFEARTDTAVIQQWSYPSGPLIPPPGGERLRINLYWADGVPGGVEQEVVIRSFTFTPSARLQVGTGSLDMQRIAATGIATQRLRVVQPSWTFQLPLPLPFEPFPLAGTADTDVWFTVHPNWQPRERTFAARPGLGFLNFHQLASTAVTEQRMVGMLYYNFFARLASPDEVDFQVTQALHKGSPTGALAENMFNSAEFNQNGRFAAGLYFGLLNRAPDYPGWRFQTRALTTGIAAQTDLIRNFLESAEYKSKWGPLTDEEFVKLLYRYVLGREATPAEVSLQAAETARVGRVEMARRFLNSAEFRAFTGPDITAFLLYSTLLNREASQAERDGWAAVLRNGASVRSVIDAFVASPEFPLAFR